jgi:hypothetical protein
MITIDFKKQSTPAKPFLLNLLQMSSFATRKVPFREGASQPQLRIAKKIINIQIPILEIPFQGDASQPHVYSSTND